MHEELYWIWIQCALGPGAKLGGIVGAFGSMSELYISSPERRRESGVLTRNQIKKIETTPLEKAAEIEMTCRKNGWHIVTPESEYYPAAFRELEDFPAALYVDGDPSALSNPAAVGMVGTRKASSYAIDIAHRLSAELASAGITVVSGGALGVDSACHNGAMIAEGKTVAFIGCGLGADYLRQNEPLRRAVAQHGALVSEFPPFFAASMRTFPIRNRLISGMSRCVIVIEAGEKSGSLVTARLASEQGRLVYAVPGDVLSSSYFGTNKLIEQGAKPLFTAYEIISLYEMYYPDLVRGDGEEIPISKSRKFIGAVKKIDREKEKGYLNNFKKSYTIKDKADFGAGEESASSRRNSPSKGREILSEEPDSPIEKPDANEKAPEVPAVKPDAPEGLSEMGRKVYGVLDEKGKSADEIAIELRESFTAVITAVTELELAGAAECVGSNRYIFSINR